jgi:CO/xanthine dehydrogenase Mo-binding subunit
MNSRRDFLKITALGGTAFILGVGSQTRKEFRPNAWLQIDRHGEVTLTVGKSEMGQGVRTSLPMILADELGADWSRVRIVQASSGPDFKTLNTGGSWSIGGSWKPLRTVGAAAREMLITAAATSWGTNRAHLKTENGFVTDGTRRIAFHDLIDAAAKLEVPKEPPLKSASEFRIIGQRISRLDGRDIVTGRAKYGIDTRIPGMLFASIVRPPVVGGKVKHFDASKAKAVRGVRDRHLQRSRRRRRRYLGGDEGSRRFEHHVR